MRNLKNSLLAEKEIESVLKIAQKVISKLDFYTEEAKKEELNKFTIETIKQSLENKACLFIVAKIKKRIVGFIVGYDYGGVIYGDWIMVLPAYQRRGIAQKLYYDLEKRSKDRGCHQFWGLIEKNNIESLQFTQKLGMKILAEFKNFWYHLDYYLVIKSI